MSSWADLLESATAQLGAEHEARFILEEASGRAYTTLIGHIDEAADPVAVARAAEMVARRVSGEPLQHIFGHWTFRHLELITDARALIPRPETEVLVEIALGEMAKRDADELVVIDIGTGSGAIACSLVAECPAVSVVACDIDQRALALATDNRSRLQPSAAARLELRESNFYSALSDLVGRAHLVVANPPYVSSEEWSSLDAEVKDHDPYGALVSGPTGLEAITAILTDADRHLVRGGAVVCEIAPHQVEAVRSIAISNGATSVDCHVDLAGRDRVVLAHFS